MITTDRFLQFVRDRHRVWEMRQLGLPAPWTTDPILASRKFTNVYRVLDPGSQFVLDLADPEDDVRDVLTRLVLYRHTNRPEPWQAYQNDRGHLPGFAHLDDLRYFWNTYRNEGGQLFSGAYMIYPQSSVPGTDKAESVIEMTKRVVPAVLAAGFEKMTLAEQFAEFGKHKGFAGFMQMQILTDWGYTPQCGGDRENSFVSPGPGSKRGLKSLQMSQVQDVAQLVWLDPESPQIELPNGHLRELSLMDIQNCLCEWSKYVRYLGSASHPKPYTPAHPGDQPEPRFPYHW